MSATILHFPCPEVPPDMTRPHVYVLDVNCIAMPPRRRALQREAVQAARDRKHPFLLWAFTPDLDIIWKTAATVAEIPNLLKKVTLYMVFSSVETMLEVHVMRDAPSLCDFPVNWQDHV
jgi:hypothetical protein